MTKKHLFFLLFFFLFISPIVQAALAGVDEPIPPTDKSLFKSVDAPQVYYFQNNRYYYVNDWQYVLDMAPKWDKNKIIEYNMAAMGSIMGLSYVSEGPNFLSDGLLLRTDASSTVYLTENNKKRPFFNDVAFLGRGYSWNNVIFVTQTILNRFQDGERICPIGVNCNEPEPCVESWSCGSWTTCRDSIQTRTCNDINNCGTISNKPQTSISCNSCNNGERDSNEQGIDCGGVCSNSCVCVEDWSCNSWSVCSNNRQTRTCTDRNNCGTSNNKPATSQNCDSCYNGLLDFNEADTDCGDSCSAKCDFNKNCNSQDDCKSGYCNRFISKCDNPVTPTCEDGIKNQNEGGIDCGGSCSYECTGHKLEPVIVIHGFLGTFLSSIAMTDLSPTYDGFLQDLRNNGYFLDETLFTFSYDYRNDIKDSAAKLKDRIKEIKLKTGAEKVDIIAHSLGGLVSRYYIESDLYDNDVDQFIIAGTPNEGAPVSYPAYEGGIIDDFLLDLVFSNEANNWCRENNVYYTESLNGINVFRYVHGRPVTSLEQVLPIYDYLYENGEARNYPDNCPENTFLDELNSNSWIQKLKDRVRVLNVAGYGKKTLEGFNVDYNFVLETGDKLWEHGRALKSNYIESDGDGRIPLKSQEIMKTKGFEDYYLKSGHVFILSNANKEILNALTGSDDFNEFTYHAIDTTSPEFLTYGSSPEFIVDSEVIFKMNSPATYSVVMPDGRTVSGNNKGKRFKGDVETYGGIIGPLDGSYEVNVVGTGDGEYTFEISYIGEDGVFIEKNVTNIIKEGQEDVIKFKLDSSDNEKIAWISLEPGVVCGDCDDGNACTTDSCNASTGECIHKNITEVSKIPVLPGLIGYWPAEGDALDSVNNNNGELMNGVAFTPGKLGQAFSFDGIDDKIDLINGNTFYSGSEARTIIAWIYPKSYAYYQMIFSSGKPLPNKGFSLGFSARTDKLIIGKYDKNAPGSSIGISLNNWSFVAVTYDSDTLNYYVNGEQADSYSFSGVDTFSDYARIGRSVPGWDGADGLQTFDGLIDELAIFNKSLTETEIKELYSNSNGISLLSKTEGNTCESCNAPDCCKADNDCSDLSDMCNLGVCVDSKCRTKPKLDETDCNDNNSLTIDDMCLRGVCVGALDCNDNNECTADRYDYTNHNCSYHYHLNPCDDSNKCTANDACFQGECLGEQKTCSDGISCTADSCDILTGNCISTPEDSRCDDGLFCNGIETCNSGLGCQKATAQEVSDNITCTIDDCNEDLDQILHFPDNEACDDSNECTIDACNLFFGCNHEDFTSSSIICGFAACSYEFNECLYGKSQICDPLKYIQFATEETCDGRDNDCDSLTDEDDVCSINQTQFIRGDVNNDGTIDIGDVVWSLDILYNQVPTNCYDTVDVNDDGKLDIADPVYLLRYLFSQGPKPKYPFPEKGFDKTPDTLTCS